MFKRIYHSISALSHFGRHDLPRPFSDGSFYENILNNIFKNKHNKEVVEVELVYSLDIQIQNSSSYSKIRIYMPKIDTKVHEEVDIEQFVAWYEKKYDIKMKKDSQNNIISYYYGDGYTRHVITICEKSEDFDYIEIEFITGRYDL